MLYGEKESKILEFKQKLPNFPALVKTAIAFANGLGGKIVIGVDDDGKVTGIEEHARDRIYNEFPNSLYDSTTPGILAEIYEKRFGDNSVIVIEIPSSIKKPVFFTQEGIPAGVYLRVGPNTRRATQDYIEELMRENKRITFDEEIIQKPFNILSKNRIKEIIGSTENRRLMAEKIIFSSFVNAKSYYPTVAGVLCFCETPDDHIPEAVILCTIFQGTSGREIIKTETIRGSIEKQAEKALEWLRVWLIQRHQLSGVKLVAKQIIPEEALREAIINALIHRKYWIPGAIKIALYEDRLEIFSPGGFPGIVNINNLGDGTTYLRNPIIAKLARRMGLIEKLGTGIQLMKESCKKAKIKQPEFIEGVDNVKVIFRFLPAIEQQKSEVDNLLALFNLKEFVTIKEVENYLNVSRNTATRKLNQLIAAKKIQRVRQGPAVRYVKE